MGEVKGIIMNVSCLKLIECCLRRPIKLFERQENLQESQKNPKKILENPKESY